VGFVGPVAVLAGFGGRDVDNARPIGLQCPALRRRAGIKTLFCRIADESLLLRQVRRNLVVIVIALAVAHGWRSFVRVVLGVGLRLVFGGQFEQTFLRHGIVGATGQAAASVGLLSKEKGLRHRTLTQQGGSPFSGSQSPAPEIHCRQWQNTRRFMSGRRLYYGVQSWFHL
jgi:hypothetical protein